MSAPDLLRTAAERLEERLPSNAALDSKQGRELRAVAALLREVAAAVALHASPEPAHLAHISTAASELAAAILGST